MTESFNGSSSTLTRTIATHFLTTVITAVISVSGTIYLNAPLAGSPNELLLQKLGLVKIQPPSLDCSSIKQDMFYGDVRQTLKACGWFTVPNSDSQNLISRDMDTMVARAMDVTANEARANEWIELKECPNMGTLCEFEFYKNNGERLIVRTLGMDFIVHSWETYWNSDKTGISLLDKE